ncbi:UNVERIFIED_CONTAM: hypothetical protein FKN15_047339 [Acipenser sinensis]
MTLCRCISSTPTDHVMLLNPPKELVPAHSLRVQYSCSRSAVVYLDVLASSETRIGVNIFRRRWRCVVDHPRIKVLQLDLPDRIIYRDDWKMRNSVWLLSAMLRAWVSSDGDESYASASARAIVLLQPLPPFSRPLKEHSLCPRWDVELLWRLHKDTIPKCKAEPEVAHFLKFVYASSGENFGIVRTLNPYGNKALEQMRQRSTTFPRCTFSTWIYLTQSCRWRFCGVLHHLDWNNNYASPAIFITHTGSLHIQGQQVSGKSAALLSEFKVPLFQWCRIDTELQAKQVNVTMVCVGDQKTLHSTVHTFGGVIQLDDTEGYFVLGGGRFVRGIEGFYGPSVYHRNGFSSAHQLSEFSLPEPIRSLDFAGWFNSCWAFKDELLQKRRGYAMRARLEGEAASCSNVYTEWFSRSDPAPPLPQCLQWEAPVHPRRRPVTRLILQMAARNGGTGRLDLVGKKLYTLFLRRVTQDGGIAKAVLLSLLAAQQDSRLALLRLGNLHHLGESGLPVDHALAYAYYSNMAAQTLIDKQHPSPGQAYVESIRLIDEEVLKQQTSENDDLFLWLRFQARRGMADAQQNLGRMLFWGQQGVSPNLQAAVKYYEASARKEENPVSMYDYAIVLLKGHGVEQDIPKALKFLNKAAKQDFVPAINALGWYYEHFEQDYERAVQFWERADEMGNPEAPFNLGVMYSLGLYPGKRADQFMAYKYYLKSARRAHTDGAIRLADVWIRGIPGLVPRLPLDAVLWTKWASEQNGYLGALLRKSLEAYLHQDWRDRSSGPGGEETVHSVPEESDTGWRDSQGWAPDASSVTGWAVLLSLLAAQQDSRLALLRLGNLHHLGESGLPVDHALAYAYYSNMAAQTLIDKQHPSPGQAYVESIRLIDEEVLKQQTSENDDLFLWLRFQARRGMADAQQNLGRMLFWGQQGVSPNLQAAVKYYEASARKEENPVSMYDYAIVLLKGHGVEQDIPKALKFLNKAAKQDFVPAINALGWYYEHFEQDYERAVQFWERADEMGNPEAPFNLGVMYSLGLYPGKRADQFMAYKYYLKSARRAHTDGAIRLADVWIRGIPGLVPQLPLDAVLWTKWASEQNGYLGALLRKSLEAYLHQDWSSALIHYLMASESGFAVAQFNLGYLCEQHAGGGYISPCQNMWECGWSQLNNRSECVWRYYNLSTYSQDPAPYALIKMGDLFYAGHEQRKRDVMAAAEMYKLAALRDEAQGWYSLGLLVQEGVELPRALLTELGLEEPLRAYNHSILTELFRRCRDHENAESYLPCSLALLNAQLQLVLRHHSTALKFTSAIGMAVVSIVTVLTTLGRLRGLTSHNGLRV